MTPKRNIDYNRVHWNYFWSLGKLLSQNIQEAKNRNCHHANADLLAEEFFSLIAQRGTVEVAKSELVERTGITFRNGKLGHLGAHKRTLNRKLRLMQTPYQITEEGESGKEVWRLHVD